ncbi:MULTISPECIES: hypothetical protein [unclassified Marinobacter]|uniref:hypothetical protein n=1 Tax=unclassified Marinobacter TaxID=83889 RepID=UPI0018F19A52|nr:MULTISPECIES: hypothetical protein [unclassified Marinobacter]
MDETGTTEIQFPRDLIEWAGHHSGGVKRLFDSQSGRPGKSLLRTTLISMLEAWARQIASATDEAPRILLLVGGPGNGKTEAIEHTIKCMDQDLAAEGKLLDELFRAFHPSEGQAVPRTIQVDAGSFAAVSSPLELFVVQDASVTAGNEGRSASELLVEELTSMLEGPKTHIYLCCVNRGILDDALIYAVENKLELPRKLLEAIARSVSLSSSALSCWPLKGFPTVASWPMDVESLLIHPEGGTPSPASALLDYATKPEHWPGKEECPAGVACPFCHSQFLLARQSHQEALLQILRWYELASGKRWSFRDLFSLLSYLLAGNQSTTQGQQGSPCEWAMHLVEQDNSAQFNKSPRIDQLTAIFHLATSGYQHALFHGWDSNVANLMRQDIKDLGLDKSVAQTRTLRGLQHFLASRKSNYLPATIATLLENLCTLLDPALASPDTEVTVSSRNRIKLGELDIRFSRSLAGGIDFVRKYQILSKIEIDLLKRLADADTLLSVPSIRRKKPTAANRLQRIIRDFACRLVRRSICSRSAVVSDNEILASFQQVVEEDDKGQSLFEVAKQVKELLNSRHGFEVSLTTTFGQPLPPPQRQATLIVQPRPVKMLQLSTQGRPRSPICFLQVGTGRSQQPIPLTYDLFKAVKELERGLSPASLPRTVVALLDTTRARLSGPIVRDPEILMDATIKLGTDGTEIGQSWNGFIATLGEGKQ